jgi:Co/Zn/Cd efflux system component
MGAVGLFVSDKAAWSVFAGTIPEPATMGTIAVLALQTNLGVAMLLYAYRTGDANMRSVWLCTRNDAIRNVAVILAALGMFGAGSGWPDWTVAILMGILALSASVTVIRHARAELSGGATRAHQHGHEGHSH